MAVADYISSSCQKSNLQISARNAPTENYPLFADALNPDHITRRAINAGAFFILHLRRFLGEGETHQTLMFIGGRYRI